MVQHASPAEGPRVTRIYRHHHLDSTRWNHFEPRDDDVIISTAYKAGTIWTQMICGLLIFQKNYSDGFYQLRPLQRPEGRPGAI